MAEAVLGLNEAEIRAITDLGALRQASLRLVRERDEAYAAVERRNKELAYLSKELAYLRRQVGK